MLKIISSIRQLNIASLMDVYRESIDGALQGRSGDLPIGVATLRAEQDLLDYLRDFFTFDGAFLGLWEAEGVYAAAVRLEPYKDGYLISGLETTPSLRRRGYASKLMLSVMEYMDQSGTLKLYSHVKKSNIASVDLHKKCGFTIVSDYAVFLDGSVFTDHYTLLHSKML